MIGEGKPIATIRPVSRRKALKITAGSAAAAVAGLAAPAVIAAGKDKILIGVPSSLSTPYGVADDTDHLNGTTMAVEEINAAGGVLGREIELFVPDVDKLNLRKAAVKRSRPVSTRRCTRFPTPFCSPQYRRWTNPPSTNAPICRAIRSGMRRLAYKADPKKYSHVLQTDPSEVNYGWTYPLWLTKMEQTGVWKPKNRKIHIVAEQVGYCQTILKAARESIPKYNFELAAVTDIQYPVNDWSPVIQKAQGSRCWGHHDRPLGRRRIRRLLQTVFCRPGARRDRLSAIRTFAA